MGCAGREIVEAYRAAGENIIRTNTLIANKSGLASAGIAAIAIPLLLVLPALWNGYPLLQWDTGGYLARWYEGYLVPSRSTVFGLYLHLGEPSYFWINLGLQAFATLWVILIVLRGFGIARPWKIFAIASVLCIATSLPWLTSLLLTDIFAGLAVLAVMLLALQSTALSRIETVFLFWLIAFSAASHSATLAVLLGLCLLGAIALPFLGARISGKGLAQSLAGLATGAVMLLASNYWFSGTVAWTPGGPGIAFGRMLQDGIVARYLEDHCPSIKLKLCPYRRELPATADQFLWGKSVFNTLGRFKGMSDEMAFIAGHALIEYPGQQIRTAATATAQQLAMVATGEGVHNRIGHTYGIFEHFLRDQLKPLRVARQQQGEIDFTLINRLHIPVALLSALAMLGLTGAAIWRQKADELSLFAAGVAAAIFGNAIICGALSGPHDRYGARLAWIATLIVVIAVMRWLNWQDADDAVIHPD